MPTYEYSCAKCDTSFDLFQSMSDDPIAVCPKELCGQKRWGKGKVKRTIGAGAGLIFKGSGFYITDYRSESYKQGAKKDAPAPAASSGESKSGSGESKASSGESKAGSASSSDGGGKAKPEKKASGSE